MYKKAIFLFFSIVSAQRAVWEQCGGKGYTGATTCVSGSSCIFVNEWYSQCQPSPKTSSTVPSSSTKAASSTRPPSTSVTPLPTSTPGTEYFFVLGDSYSSFGFDIKGEKPSAANPIGNPPFPGWGSCGPGPNWVANIVQKYKSGNSLAYNLAYGGATVNASLIAPYQPDVLSFIDQTKIFSANLASKPSYAPWTAQNSIFGIWQGINDVSGYWWKPDAANLLNQIFDDFFEQDRNSLPRRCPEVHLLDRSTSAIERSPYVVASGSPPDVKKAVEAWNKQLASRAAVFATSHSGSKTKVFNTSSVFTPLLDQGGAAANCYNSDGVTCLWNNDFHPGLKIHDALAKAVRAALAGF